MIKEVKFGGYTATPSDYEAPDGDIAALINLVPEEGHLKPIAPPAEVATLDFGERVILVHDTSVFRHYIIAASDNKTLRWMDANNAETTDSVHKLTHPVLRINAIGNTLCVMCQDGLHYILWKPDNQEYKYIGQKPPVLNLQFETSNTLPAAYDRSTIGETKLNKEYHDAWRITAYNPSDCLSVDTASNLVTFKDEHKADLNTAIWALINQANATISKDGHFYAPFYVRFCYRMYDGTMWMHSAPVFMPISTPTTYQVEIPNVGSQKSPYSPSYYYIRKDLFNNFNVKVEGTEGDVDFEVKALAFKYRPHNVALWFRLHNKSALDTIKSEWSDIIKSVDIFVSQPIIREDNSKPITSAKVASTSYDYNGSGFIERAYTGAIELSSGGSAFCNVICDIPVISEEAYIDKIKAVSNFYKVASYDLDNFSPSGSGSYSYVQIDKSALPTLATQEVMTDDYQSHHILLPSIGDNGKCLTSLYNYNGRQNVSGVKQRLFSGFMRESMMPLFNPFKQSESYKIKNFEAYVYINTEYGVKIVKATSGITDDNSYSSVHATLSLPLFYPDSRAFKMILKINGSYYERKMSACPFINGAMTEPTLFNPDATFTPISTPEINLTDTVDLPNKIYTSEVNNPFYFPVLGINTVGTGRIIGISSAAKALSQGQFGQFPLYAFTTEGVWALEVSQTGGFSAKQPITRDVCTSPESITQLDSSVLFATDRGIMLLSGSTAQCISDTINNEHFWDIDDSLPKFETLAGLADFSLDPFLYGRFRDFMKGARMIYVYNKQRIIAYNTEYDYAYVYSLQTKSWGMIDSSSLNDNVPSYPEALAMHGNVLVNYSDEPEGAHSINTILLTRPLKLDAADIMKTVDTIIQRGDFVKGKVKTALYGSRDLRTWSLIWTSQDHYLRGFRGTPYKYFRLMSIGVGLNTTDTLFGATVQFTPRLTNQPR